MNTKVEPPTTVIGGDPLIMRYLRATNPEVERTFQRSQEMQKSEEVPCQNCGRMVLISPSGMRAALGENEPLVQLNKKALLEDRLEIEGESVQSTPAPVNCMWCVFGRMKEGEKMCQALDETVRQAREFFGQ